MPAAGLTHAFPEAEGTRPAGSATKVSRPKFRCEPTAQIIAAAASRQSRSRHHRLRPLVPHSSSASRLTAGAAEFLILTGR